MLVDTSFPKNVNYSGYYNLIKNLKNRVFKNTGIHLYIFLFFKFLTCMHLYLSFRLLMCWNSWLSTQLHSYDICSEHSKITSVFPLSNAFLIFTFQTFPSLSNIRGDWFFATVFPLCKWLAFIVFICLIFILNWSQISGDYVGIVLSLKSW